MEQHNLFRPLTLTIFFIHLSCVAKRRPWNRTAYPLLVGKWR